MSYNPQNPNGQTTMANSSPVTIASDQPVMPFQIATTAGSALGAGYFAQVSGYGALRTSPEAKNLFYDPFDAAIDTTTRWNAATSSGGATATQGSGGFTLAASTTASAYSYVTSKPVFAGQVPGYMQIGFANKLAASQGVTNSYAFWGVGTAPAAPTTAAPLTDAVGWELYTDGKLYAVVYASGVRTVIQDLSAATGNSKQPIDGNYHRYVMMMRTDKTFWYIDGLDTPVATSNFQAPTVQALPLRMQVVNSATAPATSQSLISTGVGVGDTSGTNQTIGDGVNPFVKATVTASNALKVDGSAVTQPVQQVAITKGVQGSTGVTTQDLKDAGRNQVSFYTLIPVLATATDTLQSLTGTKAGATVVATTTPAVVTAGKTFRVTRLAATYIATATSGYGIVRLRFNTAGVVAITSPIAATLAVGAGTPATANSTGQVEAALNEGWEFAAATGIGISVQGFAAATATAVGYVIVSVTGYEY